MIWQETDNQNIWHPFGPIQGREPLIIERGEGAYLITPDGREILDGVSSWWVNLHGHANPIIAKAIADQAQKLEQVIFAGFTHKPAIHLSENLLSVLPSNQSKLFFSDDGSTSVEVALKLAIQYWHNRGEERSKIIAIEGAYHGDTFGAMSVADRNLFSEPFDSRLFEVHFIPFPEGDGANTIEEFEKLCDENTAAFIFEPLVQGAAGMRIYNKSILNQLLKIADDYKVVTIVDEVMTGFYRTGKFFATDYLDYQPELVSMSKGLTGGFLPMGITSASERLVREFDNNELNKTFWHGHSYTANPLACAAANASFEILTSKACQSQIKMISDAHVDFVERMNSNDQLNQINSIGTILSMSLKTEDSGYTSSIRDRMYDYFLDRNILLRPLGNVLYILPPYVISQNDLIRVYEEIAKFLGRENK
ncbi:MAG: adenosylmethionine--8-amino-7-oxononanoate transaminase [Cytophagales bacterium]|nr:adenosylmethionine--8-amino-7-oxononanoate transaminase [Cytophagales bacterium]